MARTETILVTGATGKVGRALVSALLESGARVRALVRDPSTAGLPGAVTVVPGDLTDPASVAKAAEGATAAFLLWPMLTADDAPAVLDAITEHTGRIVYLSSAGVRDDQDTQDDPISQFHADIEQSIRKTGADWTFLRAGGFAANSLAWVRTVREEARVREPFGGAQRAMVHERDIADVAVRALTEPGHVGAVHVLTGPESQTTVERVRILGETLGLSVRFEQTPAARAREEMISQGWPATVVDGFLDAHEAMEAAPDDVTTTVAEVTGHPARTFAQWVSDHADDFGARAAGNR